jgi:hypothetical protein
MERSERQNNPPLVFNASWNGLGLYNLSARFLTCGVGLWLTKFEYLNAGLKMLTTQWRSYG